MCGFLSGSEVAYEAWIIHRNTMVGLVLVYNGGIAAADLGLVCVGFYWSLDFRFFCIISLSVS